MALKPELNLKRGDYSYLKKIDLKVICMTNWKVTLEGVESGTADDIVFNFKGTKEVMDPPIVQRYVLEEVSDAAKGKAHYCVLPNVKEVISDKKEAIPSAKTAVVLMTMKDSKEKVGFLLSLKDEFKWEVIGIRPDTFAQQVSQDKSKVADLLAKVINDPPKFEDVNLILPEDRY